MYFFLFQNTKSANLAGRLISRGLVLRTTGLGAGVAAGLIFATLRNTFRKVELTSTFRNDCGNKKLRQMSVAGYVTLSNISSSLCRNKIARQVAREIA